MAAHVILLVCATRFSRLGFKYWIRTQFWRWLICCRMGSECLPP